MRGCRCAMSIRAARKSFPSLSSSALRCRAVRAGHVSRRRNMIRITAAMISATRVNAVGQEMRCDLAGFDIRRWTLGDKRSLLRALIEQERGHEQEQEERTRLSSPKKLLQASTAVTVRQK